MTSFHDIFSFLWNPFTEIGVAVLFFACVYLWFQRSELSKVLMVIPALPWLGAVGSILYFWSTSNWSWSLPINDYGVEPVYSLFNAEALGDTSLTLPGWLKFLIFFIFIGILANCALFLYTAIVRWPIQKAKEELEAAVGRDSGRRTGRRKSSFVGETGMEPSAPVTALLNRRPGSRLGNAIEGSPEIAKGRTQSDADRRAAMQRDMQQSAGGAPSVAAVALPGGAVGPSSADSSRLAQLINSIQSDTANTMSAPLAMGHCTKCGVALTQPDHHICPVPGGDGLFCGKCGAPHEPKGKVCAACGSPLNQG